MTELRTLKDIELKERGINITDLRTLETLRRYDYNLRAEAIKWIRWIEEIFIEGVEMDKSPAKTQREAYFHQKGKQDGLKHFFNITEKDLKGEQEK